MSIKDRWAKESMNKLRKEIEALPRTDRTQILNGNIIRKWTKQKWKERWNHYLDSIPAAQKTPSHDCRLGTFRKKLHQGLRKAESSLAIQLRTGKVGFAAFLHARRVPDVLSPACQCGWRRQDPKHVIVFCPNHALTRNRLYEEAGTQQYQEMLSTRKGLRAVARWVMREGLLHQFSLAKEQIDRAGGAAEKEDASEDGEIEETANQELELKSEMTGAE